MGSAHPTFQAWVLARRARQRASAHDGLAANRDLATIQRSAIGIDLAAACVLVGDPDLDPRLRGSQRLARPGAGEAVVRQLDEPFPRPRRTVAPPTLQRMRDRWSTSLAWADALLAIIDIRLRDIDKRTQKEGREVTTQQEGGRITGTADKDYNLVWFVEQCLSNALRLETYAADAERSGDAELADLFRRAQAESRKGGEIGKDLLRKRLSA
jgi:hypothetical protein